LAYTAIDIYGDRFFYTQNIAQNEENNGHIIEEEEEIFIELVRSFPCIWDMRSSLYKDSTKKKLAWHQIYKALDEKYESKYSLYGCHIYA